MFEQLFVRSYAVARHSAEPLPEERRKFLAYLKESGLPRVTLRWNAEMLLRVADVLCLADRPGEMISRDEINRKAIGKRDNFVSVATRWLLFLGRLQEDLPPACPYAAQIKAFADFLRHERGLSDRTINSYCTFLRKFLGQRDLPLNFQHKITLTQVDKAFAKVISQGSHSPRSIQNLTSHLRGFLRYAARQGWCQNELAESVRGPRTFTQQSLPAGPSWDDVLRLLAMTEGDRPVDIRDRGILMLFAIYGLRRGEVASLKLRDFDWERELITVACSRSGRTRIYPLVYPVGNAVFRYLKEVRPRSPQQEVFLTLVHPIRPLGTSVANAARRCLQCLDVKLSHYGPHTLRHACATHLLSQGMTLKEISDHLGHRDLNTTRIYAKVDLGGLRLVADFDIGGLL